MESDWRDEPALRELSAVLRESVGEEFRAEAEETERLAAVAARRGRTLLDVAAELRSRGDRVAVVAGGRTFLGQVVYVGSDLLRLRLASGDPVDVNVSVPLTVSVVEQSRSCGVAAGTGPATLRARLLELEIDRAIVEVVTTEGTAVRGRVDAVGRDHLLVRTDDGEVFVSTAAIAAVRRA
jgi:hypothetical protein